jgi:protein-arginine kinase activator protein McsA
MKIDIVNKIREDCHCGKIPQDSIETILEAADEIENLRYKIATLKELLQKTLKEAYSA